MIRRPLFATRSTSRLVARPPSGPSGDRDPVLVRDTGRPTLARIARSVRGRHLLAIDVAGIAAAGLVALSFRYGRLPPVDVALEYIPVVPVLLTARIVTNVRLGLYSHSWRQASVPDLVRITASVGAGSLFAMAVFYVAALLSGGEWLPGFPRSFWIGEALLSTAVLGGARLAIRVASDPMPQWRRADGVRGRPTLLFGAGHAGALMARSAMRTAGSGVDPVGFLDDDPHLKGEVVAGLRVYGGVDALERAVIATGATALLITMPSAPGTAVRKVVEAAAVLGLDVRTVPPVEDLLDGSLDAYRVRRLRVEDLLRRPMVTEHAVGVADIIEGKTVLITGAGGSIGSELARQVFAIGPARLILVDRAESPLYEQTETKG